MDEFKKCLSNLPTPLSFSEASQNDGFGWEDQRCTSFHYTFQYQSITGPKKTKKNKTRLNEQKSWPHCSFTEQTIVKCPVRWNINYSISYTLSYLVGSWNRMKCNIFLATKNNDETNLAMSLGECPHQQPISLPMGQMCVAEMSGCLQDLDDALHVTGETEAVMCQDKQLHSYRKHTSHTQQFKQYMNCMWNVTCASPKPKKQSNTQI